MAAAALTQYHFLRRFHPYLIPQVSSTASSFTRSGSNASSPSLKVEPRTEQTFPSTPKIVEE